MYVDSINRKQQSELNEKDVYRVSSWSERYNYICGTINVNVYSSVHHTGDYIEYICQFLPHQLNL